MVDIILTGDALYPMNLNDSWSEGVDMPREIIINDEKWNEFINELNDVRKIAKDNAMLKSCNKCKYYEGIHKCPGHAPCSKHCLGGVLWNHVCSDFKYYIDDEYDDKTES